MVSLTSRLAAAWAGMTWDAVPPGTRDRTKLVVLDTLGAMLSASRPTFPGTRRLLEMASAERTGGPCLVVGTGLRTGPTMAALVNGYLGYAVDVETHHNPAVMHASATVIPAALTVAQETRPGGAALLTSVVLGIEVACRVSLALPPGSLYARGFQPTAVCGTFGTAAAAGLLLGLTPAQMESALGLAATQASGLMAWSEEPSEEARPFNPGIATRNGVTAAKLAALDFGAPQGILDPESKYNIFRAWSLEGAGRPERLLEGFGERFAVDELSYKRYECCAFLAPAIDGLLSILAEERIGGDDIAALVMRFPRTGVPIIDNNPLRSHRAQYMLPVAAVRGRVLFEDVIFDRSGEEQIRRLMGVTRLVPDDELDRDYPRLYTTVMEVETRDGRRFSRRVEAARGFVENPMAREEILDKFRRLACYRVDAARCERLIGLVENLDTLSDLDDLFDALTVE